MLRPHSERELRDYLYRKKTDKELIEAFVAEFQEKKYQNDQDFARWWYEQRSSHNRSDRFIKSELMKKGVDSDIIDGLLEKESDQGHEMERLKVVIAKKGKLSRYQADEKK